MFCAISGSAPEEPVVSQKSGHLFEKRLVVKAIKDTGLCPITGEPLGEDDLLELKANKAVKPRPTQATSVPGLLSLFHNEWDALVLETHSMRQSLHTVRQELSHALYQHDAACRVIARLSKERDEARAALEQVSAAAAAAPQAPAAGAEPANGKRAGGEDVDMEEAPAKRPKGGITPDVVEVMSQTSLALSKGRKKRAVPPGLASPEAVAGYGLLAKQPLHKTSGGGILALDVSPAGDGVVATAGADGKVVLYDTGAARVVAELAGHSKKVKDVKFFGGAGDALVTAGVDKTARLWRADAEADGSYKCVATYSDHSAEVVAATVHPSGQYFVTASSDKTWCFYDAEMCLAQVPDDDGAAFTCASFHPDGLILGTGDASATVRIWEVRQQKAVAKFEGHEGPVQGLAFSENGYYLATCAADGVKLWDLRKLRNFKSLAPYDGSAATSVAWDTSGHYLACTGADARVYGARQEWEVVKTFTDVPKKGAYCARFAADAQALYVGTSDHNLRVYGPPA